MNIHLPAIEVFSGVGDWPRTILSWGWVSQNIWFSLIVWTNGGMNIHKATGCLMSKPGHRGGPIPIQASFHLVVEPQIYDSLIQMQHVTLWKDEDRRNLIRRWVDFLIVPNSLKREFSSFECAIYMVRDIYIYIGKSQPHTCTIFPEFSTPCHNAAPLDNHHTIPRLPLTVPERL